MAVYDRWHLSHPPEGAQPCKCGRGRNKLYPSAEHGCAKRWQVRWRDHEGRQRKRNFAEKNGSDPERHAVAFDAKVNADLDAGGYVDPAAGKTTFRAYAEQVIAERALDPGTRVKMRERLARHVYPVIGDKELRLLARRPTLIQSVIYGMEKAGLSARSIGVVMAHVSVVLACAVDDEKIPKNPMDSRAVRLPKAPKKKVTPWTSEQVAAMRAELPDQYRAMVDVGAGLGLRQGEIFGLGPDDVDWLRGVVHVRRQVKILRSRPIFAPPKGGKTRDIPLPESVKLALSEHMRAHPPETVTLPWRDLDGAEHTARLFFPRSAGRALHRDRFNPDIWRPALERAGIVAPPKKGRRRAPAREHGMHALRHYFASVLLTEGEAVQAVAEWMGHSSPKITLDTYAHLMPKSEERMRRLIDLALGAVQCAPDVPSTAHPRRQSQA